MCKTASMKQNVSYNFVLCKVYKFYHVKLNKWLYQLYYVEH